MSEIDQFQGSLDGSGKRFAIVASRFNGKLVDALVVGALDCLRRHGAKDGDVSVVRVPGAWEIPLALRYLAGQRRWDGLVALGVVIRGETHHFDLICREASHGCARVSLDSEIPVGFGVLACENREQAAERAGGKVGNKGWEAAMAALEMAGLARALTGSEKGRKESEED
ncbi:MAG TPA: 6,7-dimethyl-8-ribityllumazine synthase [Thermoanaerobaculia bacterium]|nr:6,7-dimethyl-8-ribityllumazine synthase [Thermoanaerobaculia bacterium]